MLLQTDQEILESELISNYVVPVGVFVIIIFILFRLTKIAKFLLAVSLKKPLVNHFYFKLNKLTPSQLSILRNEFSFYSKLSHKHRMYFEHRVATFINIKQFHSRAGIKPTDEMKVLISATAVMLTFGFRNYLIDLIDTILIYPEAYYSQINKTYHKGETNPQLKTIVFSWADFEHGYKIGDDNLNLGIHEFGHAIHLNASRNNDVSSLVFNRGFKYLTQYLQNHESVRQELIASKYFRAYAYTNHFEFFAVLLENFIETPIVFKSQFPELYKYIRQMLNFNFAGY